ncbi:MAG: hypothetical protein P1V51_07790 [Deltaproteobacteria bacterium]|nr:hypothetical protein [Deltaproteobacteria bacterium]
MRAAPCHPTALLPLLLLLLAGLPGCRCGDAEAGENTDPTAAIISHRDRDPVREGVVVDVVGSVSDAEDEALALTVRWLLDDAEVCGPAPPETTGITSCTLSLPAPGDARVVLEVTDRDGAFARAAVWLYGVATAAPQVTIQRPAEDQVFAPTEPVDLVALVSDAEDAPADLTVTWRSDLAGALPALAGPDAGGEVTGRVTLAPGAHRLTVEVADTTGKTGSAVVDVEVLAANLPPTCSLGSPASGGAGPAEDGVLLVGTATDADDGADSLQVTFSSDLSGVLGTLTPTSAGDVSLSVASLAGGTHALRLEARDPDGATCSDQVLYTATLPPQVQILAPSAGTHLEGTALDLDAQVSDDRDAPGLLTLSWSSDLQGALGSPSADATGFARLPGVVLPLGTHRLTLLAVDTDGQQSAATRDLTIAQVVDDPPSAPTIHLEPLPTHESDTLSVVLDAPGVDPEGAGVTHRYAWTVDGSPTGETGTSIAPALTGVGEVWEVSVWASDGGQEGAPATAATTIVEDPVGPAGCALPVSFSRVTHTQGAVDFQRVSWAPDGSHALLLGYPRGLYRYDPATGAIDLVAAGSGAERWHALFHEEGGGFALVGGDDGASTFAPVLYRYDDGVGLTAITDLTGVAQGKLLASSRLVDLVQRPGTDTFTLLSDNGAITPGIAYLNEVVFDWAGGAHAWTYEGGLNISQGASSVDWGSKLGQPLALAVSRYLEVMQYEPLLASGNFHLETGTPNHGNLKRVIFDPVGRAQAWVLQWSGQGRVYPWEGQLRSSTESFGFTGWSMYDFAVREDGSWKVFVGRNGNVWFSDSPFLPIDPSRFTNTPLASFDAEPGATFDQAPWYGTSSDYLQGAAFRPGTCEGLIVGDATASMGLVAHFALVEN